MSPRIHGYRERLYGNFYDALSVLKMDDECNRLFYGTNIGTKHLTNMTVSGMIGGDQSFVVAHLYVRTNLGRTRPFLNDDKRKEVRDLFVDDNDGDALGTLMRECQWERTPLVKALEEWSHSTVATFVVGDKPMLTMNVHDLMDGPSLGPGRRTDEPIPTDKDGWRSPLPWRKQISPVITVPVRQFIYVNLESQVAPTRALRRLATEAGVLPEPLVWVHLEGLQTRDVV